MKIPPAAFMTVGALVSVASFMIGRPFLVFFYVGIGFFGYGLFQYLVYSVLEQESHVRTVCYFCKKDASDVDSFCRHCGRKLRNL